MSGPAEYTDDVLRAYLDGALGRSVEEEIEARVAVDGALAQRLLALEPFSDAVAQSFDNSLNLANLQDIEANLEKASPPPYDRLWWTGALVACIALFAIGLFGGSRLGQSPDPLDWRESVAIYQALYTEDTVAAISVTEQGLTNQFAVAEAKIGLDLQRQALQSTPALALKRAQILGFEGAPLIQVAFANGAGAPIAFCVVRLDGSEPAAEPAFETLAGLATAHWVAGDHGFMLIGGQSVRDLEPAVSYLRALF